MAVGIKTSGLGAGKDDGVVNFPVVFPVTFPFTVGHLWQLSVPQGAELHFKMNTFLKIVSSVYSALLHM